MSFRLRYLPGAHRDKFKSIRYPGLDRPGFPTYEHAEKARHACPSADDMETYEEDD